MNCTDNNKEHGKVEEYFETVLFQSRFLVLIPVLGILIAAIVMFVKGSIEIAQGINAFFDKFSGLRATSLDDTNIILSFIPAIDNYLFATVLLIISMGLYELFISPIDPKCRKDKTPPAWLSITEWDELKAHTGEVIIMILIVNFFKVSFSIIYDHPIDLLILGGGILMTAGALVITHFVSRKIKINHR